MRYLLATIIGSLLINLLFGALEFEETIIAPIDKCIDLGDASLIYRCSEDSIWKYYYDTSNVCSGVPSSVVHYAGCSDGSINLVERCSTAQSIALSSNGDCKYYADKNNKIARPLDVCYTYDESRSRKYSCTNNGTVYLYSYNDEDCRGSATMTEQSSTYFDCDGSDCHASVNIYDMASSDTCNYADSNYKAGSVRDCNYILLEDAADGVDIPYATDVCFSYREGYYEYSYKYVCNNTNVEKWQWIDNAECNTASTHYLVSTYTSDNYTIQCDKGSCSDGKIRTYDDCDHKAYYTEYPIAWDQCIKYFHDPNTNNNDTYDQFQYYMYTCVDGYRAIFYYLDASCSDMNTFYVYNTSTSSCPAVVSGCSNQNDAFIIKNSANIFKYSYSYIISIIIILAKQLF